MHAELTEIDARVERVDRGDELEAGRVEHRLAHGRAHPPAGSEDPDANHVHAATTSGPRTPVRVTVRASDLRLAHDGSVGRELAFVVGTDDRECARRVGEHAVDDPPRVVGGDGLDARDHLVEASGSHPRRAPTARAAACGSPTSRATSRANR